MSETERTSNDGEEVFSEMPTAGDDDGEVNPVDLVATEIRDQMPPLPQYLMKENDGTQIMFVDVSLQFRENGLVILGSAGEFLASYMSYQSIRKIDHD